MAKQTEAQKKANNKYKKNKTKLQTLQYTLQDYDVIKAYCKHINSPVSTWMKSVIRSAIDSDPTFVYNPEDDDTIEQNYKLIK